MVYGSSADRHEHTNVLRGRTKTQVLHLDTFFFFFFFASLFRCMFRYTCDKTKDRTVKFGGLIFFCRP
jgi:hypothetical protein